MQKKLAKRNNYELQKGQDNSPCFKKAIDEIQKYCLEKNLKFTPLRRKVFEFLLRSHKPLGAYEVLDLLRQQGFASTPPIAYRVLDFLVAQGFVHRIQGLNAFVACSHPGSSHSPAFMICRKCEEVAEIRAKDSKINLIKSSVYDFIVEKTTVEILGVCKSCHSLETA
jgi:Fur family zinc uptake transcriptional regulator